jgi:hypothetical protein
VKVLWAIVELTIGILTGASCLFMLTSIAAVSEPEWAVQLALYWGAMFAVPLLLLVGALVTLSNMAQRTAAILTLVGSIVLSGWAIYAMSAIPQERAQGRLSSPLLLVVGSLLLIALVSDLAAYKLYKLANKGIR